MQWRIIQPQEEYVLSADVTIYRHVSAGMQSLTAPRSPADMTWIRSCVVNTSMDAVTCVQAGGWDNVACSHTSLPHEHGLCALHCAYAKLWQLSVTRLQWRLTGYLDHQLGRPCHPCLRTVFLPAPWSCRQVEAASCRVAARFVIATDLFKVPWCSHCDFARFFIWHCKGTLMGST